MYGKIKSIDKSAGPDLEFAYDATGQRIMKKVTPTSGPIIYTYYARDAQGNVMAAYTREEEGETNSVVLSELHVYGSSRIGIISTEKNVGVGVGDPTFGPKYSRYLGEKRYELVNHLGNVLEVITDRRFQIQETATGYTHTVKYYEPDVVSMQDYDPFGMITVGRSWEAGSEYRYGFNGKESDKETYGGGNIYDYGFRIFNPRLGKFLSEDPLTNNYPELTPYQFAANTPIYAIDLDGLEPNANIGGGRSNPVLNPNAPVIEYEYENPIPVTKRFLFRKYTVYKYYRTLHYYNVPLNTRGAKEAYRNEGKKQSISQHEWENGKQWQYIGPFNRRTSRTAVAASPSLTINENGSGSDSPFTKTYTLPASSSGGTFNLTFNPSASGVSTESTVPNRIIVTDATGAVLLDTGFGSATTSTSVSTTSNSVTVTVIPDPIKLAETGIVAGDADNWDLSGTFSAPPIATAPGATSPTFNSSKARITGILSKFLPLKRIPDV